jgi:hypothetical protein
MQTKEMHMDVLLQVRNQVLSVSFAPPVAHSPCTVETNLAEETLMQTVSNFQFLMAPQFIAHKIENTSPYSLCF